MCKICGTLLTLALTGYKNLAGKTHTYTLAGLKTNNKKPPHTNKQRKKNLGGLKPLHLRIILEAKPLNGPVSSYNLWVPTFPILAISPTEHYLCNSGESGCLEDLAFHTKGQ